jgi:hypothetical protein
VGSSVEQVGVDKARSGLVLGRDDGGHIAQWPFDSNVRVIPAERSVELGRVVLRRLVLHVGRFGEGQETVSETGGDPELLEVVLGELITDPYAEGGARAPDVDRNVEHCSSGDSDQLALGRRWKLVVKTAECPLNRARVVVLDEGDMPIDQLFESAVIEGLEEEPAIVTKDLWLDEKGLHPGWTDQTES